MDNNTPEFDDYDPNPSDQFDALQTRSRTMEMIRNTSYPRTDAGRGARLAACLLAEGTYRFTPWKRYDSIWHPARGVWRDDISHQITKIAAKVAGWDREDPRGSDFRQINAAIKMAQGDQEDLTIASRSDFDSHPHLLAHPNATTTDLRTGIAYPSRPGDLLTTVPAVSPEKGSAPEFEKFLAYATSDDANLQRYIWDVFGFCLPATLPLEKSFFFCGPGGTGKTTLLKALTDALGREAVAALPSEAFTGGLKADMMTDSIGKRILLVEEFSKGSRFDGVAYKRIVSRGIQHGRALHQSSENFAMTATLLVSLNYRLDLSEEGVERRAVVVPMTRAIPRNQYDATMSDKLAAEAPQILARAIEHCATLSKQNFHIEPCEEVTKLTREWTVRQDALENFANTHLLFIPKGRAKQAQLNDTWKGYCNAVESIRPWRISVMIDALKERGHKIDVITVKGSRTVSGVTLLERVAGEYTPKALEHLKAAKDPRGTEKEEKDTVEMASNGWAF